MEDAVDYSDPKLISLAVAAKELGEDDGCEGLMFELLCSASFDTVVASVRAGRANVKRMKK
ncbi:hypothetical protein [Celeribacter sp.]|uniref:hypothetical protein n=1 Tax=Celeribacter sp. TaxID=1890673 RepID=UPI003A8F82A2